MQLGHQQVDYIGQVVRLHGVGQVETVDAGMVQPGFQLVGHLAGSADQHGAATAEANELGGFAYGPAASGVGGGKGCQGSTASIVLDVLDRCIGVEAGEVDTGPA
ncbi:hypothetical protein D9M73_253280 [compost metagenome]